MSWWTAARWFGGNIKRRVRNVCVAEITHVLHLMQHISSTAGRNGNFFPPCYIRGFLTNNVDFTWKMEIQSGCGLSNFRKRLSCRIIAVWDTVHRLFPGRVLFTGLSSVFFYFFFFFIITDLNCHHWMSYKCSLVSVAKSTAQHWSVSGCYRIWIILAKLLLLTLVLEHVMYSWGFFLGTRIVHHNAGNIVLAF